MDEYKYYSEDMLIEEEESPYVEEAAPSSTWSYEMLNPKIYVDALLEFLATYGWLVLIGSIVAFYLAKRFFKYYEQLKQQKEDAEYHKDPDKNLARMEAIQRAREAQQRKLEEASQRAREEQQEREERKRAEALERLEKYGTAAGRRLGSLDDDNMPLSRGPSSSSSYRPPKRSKCGGGGCGR